MPEQLGLSPNLINLVPATMTQAEVSLDFVVDKENQLAKLAGMINTDSLFTPLSLAPGTLAVAKTVGSLAQKTIQAFILAGEQKPILQLSGAFNFAGNGSLEGYHVILGTRDTSAPLPPPTARLEVQGTSLLVDGQPADRLSYVILELRTAEARTRAAGANSPWDIKLREAEREAQLVGKDPLASDEARKQAWSYELCKQALFASARDKSGAPSHTAGWQPDEAQSRAALGIPADLDLDAALDEYLDQVNRTRANVPSDVL